MNVAKILFSYLCYFNCLIATPLKIKRFQRLEESDHLINAIKEILREKPLLKLQTHNQDRDFNVTKHRATTNETANIESRDRFQDFKVNFVMGLTITYFLVSFFATAGLIYNLPYAETKKLKEKKEMLLQENDMKLKGNKDANERNEDENEGNGDVNERNEDENEGKMPEDVHIKGN